MWLRRELGTWSIASDIADLLRIVRHELPPRPQPTPPPFVAAILEGQTEEGQRPVTLGMSGYLRDDQLSLETSTDLPLTDCRVIVFCDLERVAVHGIFCGTNVTTAALGECPTAYFPRFEVGYKLRVQCLRRQRSAA